MEQELLDVYDLDRKPTGEVMARNGDWGNGKYYCTVHIMIFNSRDQLLIQQRADCKKTWPGRWDFSAAGAVDAGESSSEAAMRELYEELGIRADLRNVRPHFTVHFDRGFNDVYLLEMELDTAELTLESSEVQAVKWVGRDELIAMNQDGQFIEYLPPWINLVFDIRHQRGVMTLDEQRGFGGQV